jgi:hypothetical protein
VASAPGKLELYVLEDTSLSTFSKPQLDDFLSKGHQLKQTAVVQVCTLTEVIGRYARGRFPDLLNLDVEGFEIEILSGVDLSKGRPKIICVETAEYSTTGAGDKRKDLMQNIESKGYYLYADTNLNSIYVDKTFWFG